MPKLDDRSGCQMSAPSADGMLAEAALNELSDELRALSMVLGTFGLLLHLDPPSLNEVVRPALTAILGVNMVGPVLYASGGPLYDKGKAH